MGSVVVIVVGSVVGSVVVICLVNWPVNCLGNCLGKCQVHYMDSIRSLIWGFSYGQSYERGGP